MVVKKLRGAAALAYMVDKSLCAFSTLALLLIVVYSLAACGREVKMSNVSTPDNSVTGQNNDAPPAQVEQPCSGVSMQSVPVYTYEIVNSWPHDTQAFTQGLAFHKGSLYESTGRNGSSTLRKVELHTGKVTKKVDVLPEYFAEGMTIFRGKIYQLTWTNGKGFIYDLNSFHAEGEFQYESEGWGLTHDEHALILSDGSNRLRFIDPGTFKVTRTINVCNHGEPLLLLNELEYVKGEIYANVWKSDRIARIDPQTGKLLGWIWMAGLLPPEEQRGEENVLNGIAYDEKDDRLFVTGKNWPKLFEIRVKKQQP